MNIYYINGETKENLVTLTQNWSEPPKLIWLEPRPTLINGQIGLKNVGLENAFQGLQIPSKSGHLFEVPEGIFIEEARFFWQKSMLHLLAQESNDGYRYFACSENKDFLKGLELTEVKSKEVDTEIGQNKLSKIFLRRDLERFNLEDRLNIDKVQVVNYWHENSLWAWRLLPVNDMKLEKN